MAKARLISVAGVMMVLLALAAAVINSLNEGRITLKAVGGVLFFVTLALLLRLTATGERTGERQNKRKTS